MPPADNPARPRAARQRRRTEAEAKERPGEGYEEAGPAEAGEASKSERTLFAGLFVAIFVYVVYEALYGFGAIEKQAALFPLAVGLPSLALAILALVQEFRAPAPAPVAETAAAAAERALLRRRTVAIVAWTVGFFLTIWFLGFITASAVATVAYLKLGAGEKWGISVALAAVAWLFFFGLFDYGLKLPFPPGELFLRLGLA